MRFLIIKIIHVKILILLVSFLNVGICINLNEKIKILQRLDFDLSKYTELKRFLNDAENKISSLSKELDTIRFEIEKIKKLKY
jgi:peptidoglycan hydrolase CwlO-like protein